MSRNNLMSNLFKIEKIIKKLNREPRSSDYTEIEEFEDNLLYCIYTKNQIDNYPEIVLPNKETFDTFLSELEDDERDFAYNYILEVIDSGSI